MGELLLTQEFKDYVFEQEFQLHFCRKADPQSKGKVENVVKYVKNNFLYARPWHDLQTLQSQGMAWLQRTGNAMPHSTTRKIPLEEWHNEQPQLRPWVSVKILPSYILRTVRKDNTFAYLGNFYSVPQGTFKNKDSMVMIWLKEEALHVHHKEGVLLCKHAIAESKGNTVINTDHKRDKSLKLKELLTQTSGLFLNPGVAMQYFQMIRKQRGRYLRDQVQAIQKEIEGRNKQLVADVLQKCIEKEYVGAVIFGELLAFYESEKKYPTPSTGKIILLYTENNNKANIQPDKSNLSSYEEAFENS
jgi:hypothetical protein